MAKGVKTTSLVMLGEIQIRMHSSSSPICLKKISTTYQKGDLFCVRFATGRIQKYPIMNIFDIIEDWDLKEVEDI